MMMLLTMAASAALAGASPVTVGQLETIQLPVRYGDLDLSSAKGRRTFDRRIEHAARTICGDHHAMRDLSMTVAIDECRAGVRASAKPQVEVAVARARQNSAIAAAAAIIGAQ